MNSLKDKLYQYRLLVIIVCICLIGGCGYGLYKSFNKKDDSYVTHVKDGDSAVVKTGDVTITKETGINLKLVALENSHGKVLCEMAEM